MHGRYQAGREYRSAKAPHAAAASASAVHASVACQLARGVARHANNVQRIIVQFIDGTLQLRQPHTPCSHEAEARRTEVPDGPVSGDTGTILVAEDDPPASEPNTPRIDTSSAHLTLPAAPPPVAPQSSPVHRVLVVEDNADLRHLVCELLETFGHHAQPAASAEEALDCIGNASFDVLLTDVRLPGMSGIDLARRLRASAPQTHVIFASGYGNVLGANIDFPAHSLAKPYDIDQLQALLTSLRH